MIRRRVSLRRDPVTAETREYVLHRDGACLAYKIDGPAHQCKDKWGEPHLPTELRRLTLDHVRDAPGGFRAPSDPAHLVSVCWSAHLYTGWATSHRPELRSYLEAVSEHTHVDPQPGCIQCFELFG